MREVGCECSRTISGRALSVEVEISMSEATFNGDTYVRLLVLLIPMEAATLTDLERSWPVEDLAHRQGLLVDENTKFSGQVKNANDL